jgi:hypothetical protein
MCQQVISTLDSVVVCDKATHALWVLEINHTITLRKILIQFRFAQGCKLPTLALVEDVALLVHISSGTCSVYAGRGTELATCSLVLESLSVLLPESESLPEELSICTSPSSCMSPPNGCNSTEAATQASANSGSSLHCKLLEP